MSTQPASVDRLRHDRVGAWMGRVIAGCLGFGVSLGTLVAPAPAPAQPCDLEVFAAPAIRQQASEPLVYDTRRAALVCIGAEDRSTDRRAIWERADGEWLIRRSLDDTTGTGSRAVYDEARGVTLILGGYDRQGTTNAAWTWDGINLHELPTGAITPRALHAMAYDPRRGVVVVYGGSLSGRDLSDTWEWDGREWTLRQSQSPPGPRSRHAMAYDASLGAVVLYSGGTSFTYRQTWAWDGVFWTLLAEDGPPLRGFASLVADEQRGVLVLTDRFNDGSQTGIDTWEWDGASWEAADRAPPFIQGDVPAAFDRRLGAVVASGADRLGMRQGALWVWSGEDWVLSDRGHFLGSPSAMATDTARGRAVAFSAAFGESFTWEWDGDAWTVVSTPDAPGFRTEARMIFDAARRVVLLFGGRDGSRYLDETWTWDGTSWVRVDGAAPPARAFHAMAYDPVREVVVLFGGTNGSALGDTWEWDGSGWTIRSAAGPRPQGRVAMWYEPDMDAVLLHSANHGETWVWDGQRWELLATDGPESRNLAIAHVPGLSRTILLQGHTGAVWSWTGSAWERCVESALRADEPFALTLDPGRAGVLTHVESVTWRIGAPNPCAGDFDGDGSATGLDVLAFLNAWTAGDTSADITGDGVIDTRDVLEFLGLWTAGCG